MDSSCRPFPPWKKQSINELKQYLHGNCLRTDRVCKYFSRRICDMSAWNTVWPEQERTLNLLIRHLENLYSATSLHHNTLNKICNIPSQPVMASSEQYIVFKFLSFSHIFRTGLLSLRMSAAWSLGVLLSVPCGFRGNGIKHTGHSEHDKYQNWRADVPKPSWQSH